MQKKADGQNYAPKGKVDLVVSPGEFPFGVIGLDHGHIYGMCNGLTEAGAEVTLVFDSDAKKVEAFLEKFPNAKVANSIEEVLTSDVKLIASASVPDDRGEICIQALQHGKHAFADKPPVTTREQLARARAAVEQSGCKFGVYYSERLHVEASVYAENLIAKGAIGKVVQVMGWGPHRMSAKTRPEWFFEKERYGGILVDIGCHQIEQILFFAGAKDAEIQNSRVANYNSKPYPNFEDFGDATLVCDNGATGYFRVDWFTPDGLGSWGDGRTLILGTDGYIELRKYLDIARDKEGDHVYMVNHEGEHHFTAAGECGFPFFGRFIRDCIDGTETAMRQDHAFRAIELAIEAQEKAQFLETKI